MTKIVGGVAPALAFGGSGLDRAAFLRGQREALARLAARPGARVVLLRDGEPLAEATPEGGTRLVRLAPSEGPVAGLAVVLQAFLGLEDGEGIWAAAMPPGGAEGWGMPPGPAWTELRGAMTRLSARDAEIAATAKALLGWHATHGFCAACGAATEPAMAGWQRDCAACGARHFPRTDPVVIMLVTHGNDVLLGRSPGWPEGMHSLLAGFMEPGETLEAAVRREVLEEAGVRVGAVGYLASQPWPFPASLMLGARGQALDREIVVDPAEIESALWVSRERMARVIAGRDAEVRAPRPGAIAGSLLAAWVAGRIA